MPELTDDVIIRFLPVSGRPVVVWLHTRADEHYVGMAIDVRLENGLMVNCGWLVRLHPDRSGSWRVLPGSIQMGGSVHFQRPILKAMTGDRLKILDHPDEISLCTGKEHIEEAEEILKKYNSM